jgi:uncharacterized protein YkwD
MKKTIFTLLLLSSVPLLLGYFSMAMSAPAEANFFPTGEPPIEKVYLALVLQQPTPTQVCAPPEVIAPDDPANEDAMATALNSQRVDNGLAALGLVSEVTQAARRHSRDMAENAFTSHTGSDGSMPWERLSEACYDFMVMGEIIGWGFGGDTSRMVDWWMNSPGHRANILGEYFEDFGVGYARQPDSEWGHYWTVNFGSQYVAYDPSWPQAVYTCRYISEGEEGGILFITHSFEPCE